jgi:hypothetical protein
LRGLRQNPATGFPVAPDTRVRAKFLRKLTIRKTVFCSDTGHSGVPQGQAEQLRLRDMAEENADVIKPARVGVGERRGEKNLRVVIETSNEKCTPDFGGLLGRPSQTFQ